MFFIEHFSNKRRILGTYVEWYRYKGEINLEFLGEIVTHKIFGKGKIIGLTEGYVTILFEDDVNERKFVYPFAFGEFLISDNKGFKKVINKDKRALERQIAEQERIAEELLQLAIAYELEAKKVKGKKGVKITDKNNIAIKYNYCKDAKTQQGEENQMLGIWNIGLGVTQSGSRMGKPIRLRNARTNSLAILTAKPTKIKERDRFIFAIFLIDEINEVDDGIRGNIVANPKFRIELSPGEAEELRFWDYYINSNKPERIVFGSGLHRYISDIQSAQILVKIQELKKGTEDEQLSKEFLEHFCQLKSIDIDSLSPPSGPLQSEK